MAELTPEICRAVLQNVPNIVTVLDSAGIIQHLTNDGVEVDDLVGQSSYDFLPEEQREFVKKIYEEVFSTGEPRTYETPAGDSDETLRWYSTVIKPVVCDGEIVAASAFTVDITDRKTTEDELQKAKDELIAQQSRAIQELSTPVIEVWEDILVLPLIGVIDTGRAQRIVESLLEAIVEKQASVVIMDITGVPIIDTGVANHLIMTVSAVTLLGTRMILTGVSPHNAQTLVKLGVDLGDITTKSSLRAGLNLAFQLTGCRIDKEG
jgi:PAS domain S-box-containing protein